MMEMSSKNSSRNLSKQVCARRLKLSTMPSFSYVHKNPKLYCPKCGAGLYLRRKASIMDLQNTATHEIEHAVGTSHLDNSCIEETMYRFATFGEAEKRILKTGNIPGTQELYR
jgi:hypothetical protein